MSNIKLEHNANHISNEFAWFSQLLDMRIKSEYTNKEEITTGLINRLPLPALHNLPSPYALFITGHNFSVPERLTLMLALAPYLKPQLLDVFLLRNTTHNKSFTEFGGIEGKQHKGFIPTGQTLLFLLAGSNMAERFSYMSLLEADSTLIKKGYITLDTPANEEPFTSGALLPSREIVELFTRGEYYRPTFNASFPAKLLTTTLEWDELVLANQTRNQLNELQWWMMHQQALQDKWDMQRKLKPGYRALFYGPPGTGKTLTASLIGKRYKKDVYRVDLSKIVSKYIGETEKNLSKVFDRAENKDWILFFDEADALFGKRTNIQTSNDRHANQEVAYLLQRIEDFNGLVILATNLKTNIDEAFLRRFQSTVYFPMPQKQERYTIWTSTIPQTAYSPKTLDLVEIADKYEVAGGTILNVAQYCTLKALENGSHTITTADVREGINKELIKMGRTS